MRAVAVRRRGREDKPRSARESDHPSSPAAGALRDFTQIRQCLGSPIDQPHWEAPVKSPWGGVASPTSKLLWRMVPRLLFYLQASARLFTQPEETDHVAFVR